MEDVVQSIEQRGALLPVILPRVSSQGADGVES